MTLKKIALNAAAVLLLLSAFLYFADWAVWRLRLAHGTGTGHATVSRFVVAPLKGNKEEYYFDGTAQVDCSRSLFPQGPDNACWWVLRHPVLYDR